MAHVCQICGKCVTTSFSLKCHLRIHSGDRPFVCRVCGKTFTTSVTLRTHASVHSGDKPFQCNTCHKGFRLKTQLREHLQVHTEHSYDCKTCGKVLKHERSLKSHMKRHSACEALTCPKCNKGFASERYLRLHLHVIHSGLKPLTCDVCGQAFGLQSSLSRHMKLHSDERKYQCEICGKGYLEKSSLRNHMLSHQGIKPHQCHICHKRFITVSEVNTHKKIHFVREKCPCPICGKMYTDARCVKSHLRFAHSEEDEKSANFFCDECGKTFKFKSQLLRHKSMHGEKKYPCTQCGKAFSDTFNLRRHTDIHKGLRPFNCEICKKTFKDKQHLVRHKIVHSDERPHLCAQCGKTFKLPKQLELHLLITHSRDRPNQCSHCGKRYKRQQDLKRHKCPAVNPDEINAAALRFIDTASPAAPHSFHATQFVQDSSTQLQTFMGAATHDADGPHQSSFQQHAQKFQNVVTYDSISVRGVDEAVLERGSEDLTLDKPHGPEQKTHKIQDLSIATLGEYTADITNNMSVNGAQNWMINVQAGSAVCGHAQTGVELDEIRQQQCNGVDQVNTCDTHICEENREVANKVQSHSGSDSASDARGCSGSDLGGDNIPATNGGVVGSGSNKLSFIKHETDLVGNWTNEMQKQFSVEHQTDGCNLQGDENIIYGADMDDSKNNNTTSANKNSEKKIYKCEKCDKTYDNLQSLAGHGKSHRRARKHKCSECEKTFHTKAEIDTHSRAHDSGQFGCGFCGKSFCETRFLSKHIYREHGDKTSAQGLATPASEGDNHITTTTCTPKTQRPRREQASKSELVQTQPKQPIGSRARVDRKVQIVNAEPTNTRTRRKATLTMHPNPSCHDQSGTIGDCDKGSKSPEDHMSTKKTRKDNVEIGIALPAELYLSKETVEQGEKEGVDSGMDFEILASIKDKSCSTEATEKSGEDSAMAKTFIQSEHSESGVENSCRSSSTEPWKSVGVSDSADIIFGAEDLATHMLTQAPSDLDAHESIHIQKQHYRCMICEKYLKLRRGARLHMRRHIDASNTCSMCRQSFGDSKEIDEHMVTHIQFDPQGKPVGNGIGNRKHPAKVKSKYVCQVCIEEFTRESRYDDHMLRQHNQRVHECPECGSSYSSRSNLNAHVLTHSTDYRFRCEVCNKGFHSMYKLNVHKITHSAERPFVCEICHFACKKKSALEEHKTRHKDEKPFECDVCHKKFAYSSGLRSHKKTHSDERKYVCDACGSAFKQLTYLKKHKLTHMSKNDRPKPYPCKICEKSFATSSDLKVHELRHKGELNYQCHDCDKKFLTSSQLKTHERTHKARENSFICDRCGKGFKENAHLQEHKRRHSDTHSRRIRCEFCIKTFMYPNELKKHLISHSGERPWTCDICGKGFRDKAVLATHVLQHSGIEQFRCGTCNKTFDRKIYLTLHTRIHTGYKPYTCRFCNKKVRTKTHLTNHERCHTGERPYACDQCPSSFSTNTGLLSHKLIHSDTKQFTCQFCSRRFRMLHHLKNHELTHTGTKPHKCDKCDKAFTQKQSLNAHLLTHDGSASGGPQTMTDSSSSHTALQFVARQFTLL